MTEHQATRVPGQVAQLVTPKLEAYCKAQMAMLITRSGLTKLQEHLSR